MFTWRLPDLQAIIWPSPDPYLTLISSLQLKKSCMVVVVGQPITNPISGSSFDFTFHVWPWAWQEDNIVSQLTFQPLTSENVLVSVLSAAIWQYWQLCYNLCKYSCKLCANIHHSQGQARISIIYDRAHTWPFQIMTLHTRGTYIAGNYKTRVRLLPIKLRLNPAESQTRLVCPTTT